MSPLRLFKTLIILLIGLHSKGQVVKDSLIQKAEHMVDANLEKIESNTATIVSKKDSLVNRLENMPVNTINNVEKSVAKYDKKADSALNVIQELPAKYFKKVDTKITKYSNQISSKTEKTLTKLSKWENKIKRKLDKINPQASARLFSNKQMTFTALLQKVKNEEKMVTKYKAEYDEYQDKLTTNLKYIETQKDKLNPALAKSASVTSKKMKELNQEVAKTDAIQKMIKDRKKLLMSESLKYLGKSKYLAKIDKESYYYTETLRNYKDIFSDPVKAEKTVKTILNKIPAFQKFSNENNFFASLFGPPVQGEGLANSPNLQTRAMVNSLVKTKVAGGGANASQVLSQNLQEAKTEIKKLQDKVQKSGKSSNKDEMPDFKPNTQKSKTFAQRLEYDFNTQFGQQNKFVPTTANLGLGLGYKINDKSIIGIGVTYKLGMGSIDHIKFTHQGIGLRTYVESKLKKQFYISGGFEMNHDHTINNFKELKYGYVWQRSGLIGISKKIKIKTKFFKNTKLQLLYDFLYQDHYPNTQPIIFRTGYNF
ncbi:MAG: hypothetical protein QM737_02640 [Ferruginibacter sp.]